MALLRTACIGKLADDFGFQLPVPGDAYVPLRVAAVHGSELYTTYMHRAGRPGHKRHPDAGADQIENGKHVVRFIDNPRSEPGAVAQADAMIVIRGRDSAIDQNEWLVLNPFHGQGPGELFRSGNGKTLCEYLAHRDQGVLDGQAYEADVEA